MILESMNRLKIFISFGVLLMTITSCYHSTKVSVETHFWAPNSFSPNKDGINDLFFIIPVYGVDIKGIHISIYDQNLQKVFEADDIQKMWDGKFQNIDAPSGNYEYQVLYNASTDSVNYDFYITASSVNLFR